MDAKSTKPVVWSIAGLDSGGGAGLSADQRAADAAGVHLCPVAAAITAQNSVAVQSVHPVLPEQLHAQLTALAEDLHPAALKTGLLGGVAQLRVVTHWIDQLRQRGPLAVVVDPVLRASSGAALADEALIRTYREELLPRATVITPNRREAARLLGEPVNDDDAAQPERARSLVALGAQSVVLTGGDSDGALAMDFIATPQAQGWLALPRRVARNTHGTGCTHATALAAALARGFVPADAAVLAKMLTTSGLQAEAADPGSGPGPVRPLGGFIGDASLLPALFDGDAAPMAWPRHPDAAAGTARGVYAITQDGEHAAALFASGVPTVQLRIKRGAAEADSAWWQRLAQAVQPARQAAQRHGATLVLNDHWQAAIELGVRHVHLGQEDLLALDAAGRQALAQARAAGLRLGLSSHSLWELARASAWAPDYVACGPVWPTTTKAMPWRPQGLDNLDWWVRMAPAPVVGIGGVLDLPQLSAVAATGAAAGCVVRAVADARGAQLQPWLTAWADGAAQATPAATPAASPAVMWPHPSL